MAFGSTLAGNCELGRAIEIESDCYIHNAYIGDHVQIRRGCSLFDVRLAGPNVIYQNSHLVITLAAPIRTSLKGRMPSRVNLGRFCSYRAIFQDWFWKSSDNFCEHSPDILFDAQTVRDYVCRQKLFRRRSNCIYRARYVWLARTLMLKMD